MAYQRLGIFLMVLSGIFFVLMISLPWLNLATATKFVAGITLFVLVQSSWWIGLILAGPSTFKTFRGLISRKP